MLTQLQFTYLIVTLYIILTATVDHQHADAVLVALRQQPDDALLEHVAHGRRHDVLEALLVLGLHLEVFQQLVVGALRIEVTGAQQLQQVRIVAGHAQALVACVCVVQRTI